MVKMCFYLKYNIRMWPGGLSFCMLVLLMSLVLCGNVCVVWPLIRTWPDELLWLIAAVGVVMMWWQCWSWRILERRITSWWPLWQLPGVLADGDNVLVTDSISSVYCISVSGANCGIGGVSDVVCSTPPVVVAIP